MEETLYDGPMKMPEPVHYSSSLRRKISSRIGSTYSNGSFDNTQASSASLEKLQSRAAPRQKNGFVDARNERRYRYLLEHEYHSSRTSCTLHMSPLLSLSCFSVVLSLWEPSHVQIGDVGYLSKPSGMFVTLFNSIKAKTSGSKFPNGIPHMNAYGDVSKGHVRLDKRNVAQKGLDAVSGLLTFRGKGDMPISLSSLNVPL